MTARFASFVSGRRTKWIVLGLWLVGLFAAMGANLPGKFSDAEKNESRSFLPENAESTKALDVTERLQGGDIDEVGVCDGDVLYYCEAGQLYFIECAEEGLSCGFDAEAGWFTCF